MDNYLITLFIGAVLLLPRCPLAKSFKASFRRDRAPKVELTNAAREWRNWLDAARGAVGGYLMVRSQELRAVHGDEQNGFWIVPLAIMAVAILVNSLRYQERLWVLLPVFFLSGLTLALSQWPQGVFAVGTGWAVAIASRQIKAQLPTMFVALAGAAALLGQSMPVLVNLVLLAVAVGLWLLFESRTTLIGLPMRYDRGKG